MAADPPKKLNVLFLMSDDMRPELGCYGHPVVKSPNIDALAKAGVRFDRAYCQYPLCNPSRTSLLTGRHPTTTGVLDNTVDFRTAHPDWVTLPEHFKANGYVTLRTGKIFHGGIDDAQSWTEGGGGPQEAQAAKKVDPKERDKRSDRIVVLEGDGESHGDYSVADRAIEFLRKHKDRPFFLACGFTKPHSPPTAPKKFFDLYDPAKLTLPKTSPPSRPPRTGSRSASITPNGDLFIGREATEDEARKMLQAYYASMSWTDWNVGRVVAELDRLGLRENTVIVFWGDHGYHLGEFGKWAKHGSLFETGTRVPLIVVAPGAKGNGTAAPVPVQSLDIYPTLCELCGLKPPAGTRRAQPQAAARRREGEVGSPGVQRRGEREEPGRGGPDGEVPLRRVGRREERGDADRRGGRPGRDEEPDRRPEARRGPRGAVGAGQEARRRRCPR